MRGRQTLQARVCASVCCLPLPDLPRAIENYQICGSLGFTELYFIVIVLPDDDSPARAVTTEWEMVVETMSIRYRFDTKFDQPLLIGELVDKSHIWRNALVG